MKKSILWMLLIILLIGCGTNDLLSYDSNDVYYSFSDTLHTLDINEDANLVNDEVDTDISFSEIIMDDEIYLDIIELGKIIVTAMSFWEDWWDMRGRFGYEHLGYWNDIPKHNLALGIYQKLLPTSGFESLQDIKNYLLKFYTETFLESIFSSDFSPFVEYENILYMHGVRAGFSRTNWETAIHSLVEKKDNYVIIETSALHGVWHMFPNLIYEGDREEFFREAQKYMDSIDSSITAEERFPEVFYRITLIEGRIENVSIMWNDEEFKWSIFGG
ncbi:MAG: hypothetical protein FWF57_00420 [Defluviitaleaceae bacterium]|nr:hypothetical protein [Defluviitaleaceae bacterium]